MTKKPAVNIAIDADPKRELKALGGGDRDQWNERLVRLVTKALPVNQEKTEAVSQVGSAVMAGVVDMKPADPIEGMLISQLVVANEAALSLYKRAWACVDYFEAHTKYLHLADKASRTVALLSERLDQHRGRGQQQIIVKHVTVNADQAVVADQIVSGKAKDAALLTSATEEPMENLEPSHMKAIPVAAETK